MPQRQLSFAKDWHASLCDFQTLAAQFHGRLFGVQPDSNASCEPKKDFIYHQEEYLLLQSNVYHQEGIYCYKVILFGLKNVEATYQRLFNKMFSRSLRKTMEVYIHDIVVKSLCANGHV